MKVVYSTSGGQVSRFGDLLTAADAGAGEDFVEFDENPPGGWVQGTEPTSWVVTGTAPDRQLVGPGGVEYAKESESHAGEPDEGGGSQTVISDTDPGAIGAGSQWIRTDPAIPGGAGSYRQLYVRNEANDGWISVGIIHYDGSDVMRFAITSSDDATDLTAYAAGGSPTAMVSIGGSRLHFSSRQAGGIDLSLDGSYGSGHVRVQNAGDGAGTKLILSGNGVGENSGILEVLYSGTFGNGGPDPSAGAGVVAQLGALYSRNVGDDTGELWVKTGSADTAWTKVNGGSQPFEQHDNLATDPNTFLVTETFEVGYPSPVTFLVTVTAVTPDGETFGSNPGNIIPGVTYQVSADGITWSNADVLVNASTAFLTGLPGDDLVTVGAKQGGGFIVPKFGRITVAILDDGGSLYAGANNPTIAFTLDYYGS